MEQSVQPAPDPSRRRTLSVLVNAVGATIGGALATLLGVFAVRPGATASRERWLRAGTLDDLIPDVPVPRVVAVPRVDGWYRARARETVFLIWNGARDVTAFSATCTHLGCQVHWDGAAKRLICPCHGGAYDAAGRVIEGPPPRPLDTVATRVDAGSRAVLVRR
ncbi:MAG TPA: ubiquinol-cytochrome c reductase iron-sulfur subunit [Vicinamibacterales bacterium]|nr:ubiquinol-cytochrome c reductase iron-sulfur subunit [Vicinamibacterales bacterium]